MTEIKQDAKFSLPDPIYMDYLAVQAELGKLAMNRFSHEWQELERQQKRDHFARNIWDPRRWPFYAGRCWQAIRRALPWLN